MNRVATTNLRHTAPANLRGLLLAMGLAAAAQACGNGNEAQIAARAQAAANAEATAKVEAAAALVTFKADVLKESGGMAPEWSELRWDEAEPPIYRLTIIYKTRPRDMDQVRAHTTSMAHAVLQLLVKAGKKPAKDYTTVTVWGQQDGGKGETGEPLIRAFGYADYDNDQDQVVFREAKAMP